MWGGAYYLDTSFGRSVGFTGVGTVLRNNIGNSGLVE